MVTNVAMPNSSSCLQTLASAFASAAVSKKRSGNDVVFCQYGHRVDCLSMFSTTAPSKLNRTGLCELSKPRSRNTACRASSASFEAFPDEEFSKKMEELATKFWLSADNSNSDALTELSCFQSESSVKQFEIKDCEETHRINSHASSSTSTNMDSVHLPWREICKDPPRWLAEEEDMVIERKANSLDLPLSLRIIQRKKQSQHDKEELGFRESTHSSVKKAFSSMVFIISELHSYTLHMRELLFYEDLQGILAKVQSEMQASFVWLFQQVFSHTPTFMIYVMILLANFTVHSMANNAAVAMPLEFTSAVPMEVISTIDISDTTNQKFNPSKVKSFSFSSTESSIKTYVGGNHGGGGKARPVVNGTDGDGWLDRSGNLHSTIVPNDSANQVSPFTAKKGESVAGQGAMEEVRLWNAVADEASRMQAETRGESLDDNTIQDFVSPVTVTAETDVEQPEYFRTELLYRMGLAQEPENPLLLANFAQFLYTVAQDYDRAEEYFKEATSIEPKDAEACSKYANFLWHVKGDLWAAEETYLEAISAEPGNSHYAADYAHFLWNTGGEDTCFPLDSPEEDGTSEA